MTERKWWQILPSYGNWGGPGWSSGFWHQDPTLTDWTVPPVDYMDALFRDHDRAYQTPGADRSSADYLLVHCLALYQPKTLYGRLYRIGAIVLFTIVPLIREGAKWVRSLVF